MKLQSLLLLVFVAVIRLNGIAAMLVLKIHQIQVLLLIRMNGIGLMHLPFKPAEPLIDQCLHIMVKEHQRFFIGPSSVSRFDLGTVQPISMAMIFSTNLNQL